MYAEDSDSSNASRQPAHSENQEQTMQGRVQPFEPGALEPAQRELFEAIAGGPRAQGPQHFALTRPDGSLRGPFNAFLLAPELGGALQNLGAAIRYRGELTPRAREIAILLVAAHWDSEFEREAHEAVGAASGLRPDELAALRDGDATAFAGDEGVVAAATVQLLAGDLDNELWRVASEAIGAEVVFELTTLVGYYSTLALQLRVFRVAP
jgi:4-carboxymuconolactone decarboxylase